MLLTGFSTASDCYELCLALLSTWQWSKLSTGWGLSSVSALDRVMKTPCAMPCPAALNHSTIQQVYSLYVHLKTKLILSNISLFKILRKIFFCRKCNSCFVWIVALCTHLKPVRGIYFFAIFFFIREQKNTVKKRLRHCLRIIIITPLAFVFSLVQNYFHCRKTWKFVELFTVIDNLT